MHWHLSSKNMPVRTTQVLTILFLTPIIVTFILPKKLYPCIQCGKNATESFCSSRCEETCKYKSLGCPPRICGGPCVCRMGYVIDEIKKDCVLRRDCSEQQVEVPSYEVTSVLGFGANYDFVKELDSKTDKSKNCKSEIH